LQEKRKNVHAGVSGTRIEGMPELGYMNKRRVTYNPYKADTFIYCDTGLPVLAAKFVILNDTGCYVVDTV
jgi:hypothetical protein